MPVLASVPFPPSTTRPRTLAAIAAALAGAAVFAACAEPTSPRGPVRAAGAEAASVRPIRRPTASLAADSVSTASPGTPRDSSGRAPGDKIFWW